MSIRVQRELHISWIHLWTWNLLLKKVAFGSRVKPGLTRVGNQVWTEKSEKNWPWSCFFQPGEEQVNTWVLPGYYLGQSQCVNRNVRSTWITMHCDQIITSHTSWDYFRVEFRKFHPGSKSTWLPGRTRVNSGPGLINLLCEHAHRPTNKNLRP